MTTDRDPVRREGRPTTLPEPWLSLATALGGVAELAEAAGVHRSSVWSWARGRRPGLAQRRAVNALARRRGLDAPWPEAEQK